MANLKDTIILGDLSVTGAVTTNNINIQDLYVGSISPISGTSISVGGSLAPAGTGHNIGTSGNRWNFGYFSALDSGGAIKGVGSQANSGLMKKYSNVSIQNASAMTARAAATGVKCYVAGISTSYTVYFSTTQDYSGMFCVALDERDIDAMPGYATCYFYGTCYRAHSSGAVISSQTLYAIPN